MNRIGRWLLLLTLALTGAAASAHESFSGLP